ncbi:unnamed protein product, partial [Mesorhabditis belari]|uniref:RING-type E3 ubiquitin transferase n=1 Tax=Mesorhabditis belari TaxID=2138241 RepID=A0AAF3EUJ1_9BILA
DVVPHCAMHPCDNMLYCESCDLVFCQQCQETSSNKKCSQHTVIPLAIALKRMSEIMLYRTKSRLKALEQAQTAINEEIRLLDTNADTIVDQINSAFQEVSHIIETRRRELLESVRVRRDDKRKVLRDQMESLSDEMKKLDKELESGSLDVRELGRRIREWESNGASRMDIEPRENAFLRLNTNDSQLTQEVQRCVGAFGALTASSTFPGASTIDQTESATTHTETLLKVTTCDVNGKLRNTGGDPISACIEGDGCENYNCSVKDNDDGTYDVIFRIRDPGEYRVNVKIFGRPVKNSPFLVTVESHHSPRWQLAVELRQPTRVCLQGPHIFYVLDTGNNRIRIVKDNGDVINDIFSPCLEGGSAVGMAMIDAEHLAVLNWKTKSVNRIDTKGIVSEKMTFAEFQEPIDLAVDRRGRLLIADADKVFVFDATFRYLFSFAAKQQQITCVNVGLNDDIMVGTKHGLQLFDGAGRFLREIPVNLEEKRSMMVTSCAVCPSTARIISGVVDPKTNRAQLAVSQYKGQFVFHIDSFGSRLRRPCGLSVAGGDRVGQCFVVDHACHTVRIIVMPSEEARKKMRLDSNDDFMTDYAQQAKRLGELLTRVLSIEKAEFSGANVNNLKSCIDELVKQGTQLSKSGVHDLFLTACTSFEQIASTADQPSEGPSIGAVLYIPKLDTVEQSPEGQAFSYVLGIYNRIQRELKSEFTLENEYSFCEILLQHLYSVTGMLLAGELAPKLSGRVARLAFCKRMYLALMPEVFLQTFVEHLCLKASSKFVQIFDLILTQQKDSLVGQSVVHQHDNIVDLPYKLIIALLKLRVKTGQDSAGKDVFIRPFADLIANREDFVPECLGDLPGREIQRTSFLGPFFDFSLPCDEGSLRTSENFFGVEERPRESELRGFYLPYQNRINAFRTHLLEISKALLGNVSSRSRTLDFFAAIIKHNAKRAQMRADFSKLASHGFIFNILCILYDMSFPIDYKKVNPSYPLSKGARVDISEQTRFQMDLNDAREYADQLYPPSAESPPENFSTECFFLTMQCENIGMNGAINRLKGLKQHIGTLRDRLENLEEELRRMPESPMADFSKQQLKKEIEHIKKNKTRIVRGIMCFEALIQDEAYLTKALDFSSKQLSLLINGINGDFTVNGILPPTCPPLFAAYPEFYLDNLLDLFSYCLQKTPMILSMQVNFPVQLLIFLCSQTFVRNPFLSAKVVEVVALVARMPLLWNPLINHPVALRLLLPSLVKFYAFVEERTDFYEKFSIRYHIQTIFKILWDNIIYQATLIDLAKECSDDFIRFINMIINDATFHLDESLAGLKKIHDIEGIMNKREEWASMNQEEQQGKMEALDEAKRMVRNWLYYANYTLDLLGYLTAGAAEPFLKPILGERLATMLDHNISQLCGKKCSELKVRDAEQRFNWKPKELATQVVIIYLNLSGEEFAEYIAKDERTYKPQLMTEIIQRMLHSRVVSDTHRELFTGLMQQAEQIYKNRQSEEEELDDAPDEFLDPLMNTLMRDPVKTPSGMVFDRVVITRHLLTSKTNPFTREALDDKELQSDDELRERINQWIREKLTAKGKK